MVREKPKAAPHAVGAESVFWEGPSHPALSRTERDKHMQLPHFIQIEPVGQCNLRCQMCPIQFRRDGPRTARRRS